MGAFKIVIVRIVSDGWRVGEVELMAGDKDDINKVKQRIEELTKQFYFEPRSYGKVRHCLKTQNLEAYNILCNI